MFGCSNVAYLVGALRDGSVFYDKANRTYKSVWYQKDPLWLLHSIQTRVHKTFGKKIQPKEYKKGQYQALLCSKKAFLLFKNEYDFVSPQINWNTPTVIRQAQDKTIAAYIAGFFDAEGDISVENYVVGFSQKNREPLQFIRDWLQSKGVICSEIFCADKKSETLRFYITSRKNHYRFNQLVPFEHPDKRRRLTVLLQCT